MRYDGSYTISLVLLYHILTIKYRERIFAKNAFLAYLYSKL
nr:MAG TPA: hypothetical protein [Caudoviricetes sp.]DAW00137.1 MAG TPA: hypothetical protein [Caudoviricetes sp.]